MAIVHTTSWVHLLSLAAAPKVRHSQASISTYCTSRQQAEQSDNDRSTHTLFYLSHYSFTTKEHYTQLVYQPCCLLTGAA